MKTNTIHPNQIRRMFTPSMLLPQLIASVLHENETIGNAAADEVARRFWADETDISDIMHAAGTAERYAAVQQRILPALNRSHP